MTQPPRKRFSPSGAHYIAAALIGAGLIALSAPSYAASDDGASTTPSCRTGTVWSSSKKKCVATRSDATTDEDRYQTGWKLAKAGQYRRAIAVLSAITRKDDPRVLNYLGYSHRKLGDLKTGIKYYKQALAVDPDFVLAREYLGEGYVKAGRLDLARLELDQIKKRCGSTCKEYVQLAAVIKTGVSQTW